MMFREVICPHCGNEIVASSRKESQFCKFCRRTFKVEIKKLNKEGKKPKFAWKLIPDEYTI